MEAFCRGKKSFGELLTSELVDNSCLAYAPNPNSLGKFGTGFNRSPTKRRKKLALEACTNTAKQGFSLCEAFARGLCQQATTPYGQKSEPNPNSLGKFGTGSKTVPQPNDEKSHSHEWLVVWLPITALIRTKGDNHL